MGTLSPSFAMIFRRTPSSGASTSKTAFSVSTSQITSPFLTVSPSSFNQFTTVPSVISCPPWGMMIFVAIVCLRSPPLSISEVSYRVLRMPSMMSSTVGAQAFSKSILYGIGVFFPAIRRTGPSRSSYASSMIMAAISPPMPPRLHAS